VLEYYGTDRIDNAFPVPDALEGVKRLKEMGFKLVVVTARTIRERERSLDWTDRHFPGGYPSSIRDRVVSMCYCPGIFETVICTGQSQETTFAGGHELITRLNKADVGTQRISEAIVSNGVIARSASR